MGMLQTLKAIIEYRKFLLKNWKTNRHEDEAQTIVKEKIEPYGHKSYDELVEMVGHTETFEITGRSGAEYQVEIKAFWDDKSNSNIRVMAAIDESPQRPVFWRIPILRWIPIYGPDAIDSFIMSPSGTFIGKETEIGKH